MKAAEFYKHFEAAFAAASHDIGLRRLKSPQPNWTAKAAVGIVSFKFSTNSRAAGLLPMLWPGEFRPLFEWSHLTGAERTREPLSFFQYADPGLVEGAVTLQRSAIQKYLRGRYEHESEREKWIAKFDPFHKPVPNIEQWFYYFDAADALSWGRYFGGFIGKWLESFNQHPESLDSWCARVLWKDAAKQFEQ